MISKIKGKIEEKLLDSVIVDVSGVGYEIYLGGKQIQSVVQGESVNFYTHLSVSKDMDFKLYGFKTASDLKFFKLLCTVSGVGPKSAFNIISFEDTKSLSKAISNADKAYFKNIPGVGNKLALKIIVDLQEKVGKHKEIELTSLLSDEDKDILKALSGMGYDAKKARELLQGLPKDLPESAKIKQIIGQLSK